MQLSAWKETFNRIDFTLHQLAACLIVRLWVFVLDKWMRKLCVHSAPAKSHAAHPLHCKTNLPIALQMDFISFSFSSFLLTSQCQQIQFVYPIWSKDFCVFILEQCSHGCESGIWFRVKIPYGIFHCPNNAISSSDPCGAHNMMCIIYHQRSTNEAQQHHCKGKSLHSFLLLVIRFNDDRQRNL